IVQDVSGSMVWNFDGVGTKNGQNLQCGATNNTNVQRAQCPDDSYAYQVKSQRRIYVAKQAITRLVNMMKVNRTDGLPDDQMRIIAFSDTTVYDSHTWTSDQQTLKNNVLAAGSQHGDPYKTDGGTGSATALEKAAQAIASADSTAVGSNGQ